MTQLNPQPKRSLTEALASYHDRLKQAGVSNGRPAKRYVPTNHFDVIDPNQWQLDQQAARQALAEQAEQDHQAFLTGVEKTTLWHRNNPMASTAPYVPACVNAEELEGTASAKNLRKLKISGPLSECDDLPSIDLLSSGTTQAADEALLKRQARLIETTLDSFGAPARVVSYRTGSTITQFHVEPGMKGRARVKVKTIEGLAHDLQLALGARTIRIEAPVPGKGYVGIEIPNGEASTVHLRDVMESAPFRGISAPLALALGQHVDGTPIAVDLATMPHLLIAGTTGAGKSVCMNAIIAGLLMNNAPDALQLVMVDPKKVELVQYNGIPHLVAPVATSAAEGVRLLRWVSDEMDRRYDRLSAAGARNIGIYNQRTDTEPMPYIVVVIDELADLMLLSDSDTEDVLAHIAAQARAAGIHLVIATQRPSADVVTGIIKSNFSTRIALAVASINDSRTIIDYGGAEKLLGSGDMLFASRLSPAPARVQGVYVSDAEISAIADFWRGSGAESNAGIKPEPQRHAQPVQENTDPMPQVRHIKKEVELHPAHSPAVDAQTAYSTDLKPQTRRHGRYAYASRHQRHSALETPVAAEITAAQQQLKALAEPFLEDAFKGIVKVLESRSGRGYSAQQRQYLATWLRQQMLRQ